MTCKTCEPFEATIELQSPTHLARVMEQVQAAVEAKVLCYESFESDRELVSQPSFMALVPEGPWPDVMSYHFTCMACSRPFILTAETYHGSGGSWSPSTARHPSRPLPPPGFGRV